MSWCCHCRGVLCTNSEQCDDDQSESDDGAAQDALNDDGVYYDSEFELLEEIVGYMDDVDYDDHGQVIVVNKVMEVSVKAKDSNEEQLITAIIITCKKLLTCLLIQLFVLF